MPDNRRNAIIAVTASKGGVGKSTYAKLVANTVIQLGYKFIAADLDAQHADFAKAFSPKEATSFSIVEMDSFDRATRAMAPEEAADELIQTVLDQMRNEQDAVVTVINTPPSAITTIERFAYFLLPEHGKSEFLPNTDVYVAYILTPEDKGDIYQEGSPFLQLGPEHLVTVLPELKRLSVEQRAERGATPEKTTITSMAMLPPRAHRQHVLEAPTANFRDVTLLSDAFGMLTHHWWFTQVPTIAKAFNLSVAAEPGSTDAPRFRGEAVDSRS